MEEVRDGDLRFPIISCLFFLCFLIGGALLAVAVFLPNISQPWFVTAAMALIGFPWVFWLIMYIKSCFRRRVSPDNRQISRRGSCAMPTNSAATSGAPVGVSSSRESEMPLALSVSS